jgi:hypothetical protein
MEPNTIDLDRYGLGNHRSLNAYEQFSGVDFKHQRLTEAARSGMSTNASKA